MNAKEVLFKTLDNMNPGYTFKTVDLVYNINKKINRNHFHDTYLRYIREWRVLNTDVICVNKAKSIYRKVS